MKPFATFLIATFVLAGSALAREPDTVFVQLADQLIARCSDAVAAATPADDMKDPPPCIRNWRLRDNLGDIRKIALKFRDRAARGKARRLSSRLKVKRMVANMKTCNFLVQNHAARGLVAFPAAYDAAREAIGGIVSEMCCGDDGDQGGSKSR